MRRDGRGWTRVMVAALAVGCAGDASTGPTASVSDSAGVRIVSYDLTDAAVDPYARVGDHVLEIGVMDGSPDYTFSGILDVRTRQDGSVLVSDAGGDIRIYGEDGVHIRTLGRRGDGPGEFATGPAIVGLVGDTVFAWDGRARRVTAFSDHGRMLETTTLLTDAIGPLTLVRHSDGTYVAQSRWVSPAAAEEGPHDVRLELDSVVIDRRDATGAVLDTVDVLADMERVRRRQALDGGRFAMQMMPRPLTARAFLRSNGAQPIIAHNKSFELVRYDEEGRPREVLRVAGAWPTVSADEIRSTLEAQLAAAAEDGEVDPRTLRVYEEFMPEQAPTFSDVLISAEGQVWVASYEFDASDGYEWLVFSATGQLHGTVRTPPDLRVSDIGSGYLVGVVRDELDVEYVRRYPLLEAR